MRVKGRAVMAVRKQHSKGLTLEVSNQVPVHVTLNRDLILSPLTLIKVTGPKRSLLAAAPAAPTAPVVLN
jgi:hypothetical protein